MAFWNKNKEINLPEDSQKSSIGRFQKLKSAIDEIYNSDKTIPNNVKSGSAPTGGKQITNVTIDSFLTNYLQAAQQLKDQRGLSRQAYTIYPVYQKIIDYLSNMYCWRYTYVPRLIKDKGGDYAEMYNLMGEVVDGVNIETIFPQILTNLFLEGATYLMAVKTTSSHTISLIMLPAAYCKPTSVTQFGTVIYAFNYKYFDDFGYSKQDLETVLSYYPKEMTTQYNLYKKDPRTYEWQKLNPKFAAALLLNESGVPNKLYSMYGILQHQQYLKNELERNGQLLDKIISHKVPTWQDKLVIDLKEMVALHNKMANVIARNNHVRLLSSFGDIQVHSIGQDQAKENKTLENSYNAIFDLTGLNYNLFNGNSVNSLDMSLLRDKSEVWKYVQQLMSYVNLVVNNLFNFKGYQCQITMLPITVYDEKDRLLDYEKGATLGVNKLEYLVASGIKQINLSSKFELEDYLKLDQLKPLSTSYTQNDNSKKDDGKDKDEDDDNKKVDDNNEDDDKKVEDDDDSNKQKEDEVKQDE